MSAEFSTQEITQFIENIIAGEILEIRKDNLYNWDEDYITLRILQSFRKSLREVKIKYRSNKIYIKSNFFKYSQRNRAEYRFGDIGIIFNISYEDANNIEGVAILEAKRIFTNNDFRSVNIEQLNRLVANAPHSYLILYDFDRIDKDENYKNYLQSKSKFFQTPLYASIIPINLALKFNQFNKSIYRFSTAFSYQFIYRYIHGLDLEFSDDAINTARGYQQDEIYPPEYLVTINVKHTKNEGEFNPSEISINTNDYEEIVSSSS